MMGDESRGARLEQVRALMREGRHDEAIAWLGGQLRRQADVELERLLAECRYLVYLERSPQSAATAPRQPPVQDPFAGTHGIPEIPADRLDAAILAAAIHHRGALLVRGLVPMARAEHLADGVRQALDACAAWHGRGQGAFDSPWYARLPMRDGCELADARPWVEGAGGVWTADSPRMLHEVVSLFEDCGIIEVIGGYFGERPLLSVGKSTLRCVPASQREADWHQDGAFMGADIRSMNLWLSLSHCGEDASGLEFVPRRFTQVLPTGSHGANFQWSVGPGLVAEAAGPVGTASPRFAPGDAMLFDHFFLHRTGVPAGIARDRYAIESWFFAPSAYPAQQVPLKV